MLARKLTQLLQIQQSNQLNLGKILLNSRLLSQSTMNFASFRANRDKFKVEKQFVKIENDGTLNVLDNEFIRQLELESNNDFTFDNEDRRRKEKHEFNREERRQKSKERELNIKKQREFQKNEHHKYEYDEKTHRVKLKEDDKKGLHHKGITEKDYLKAVFSRQEFKNYMSQQYQIIPLLISPEKINKFVQEIEINGKYQDHIKRWQVISRQDKNEILEKEKLNDTEFQRKFMYRAKPYIELYTDFILRYFKEQFENSQQLVSMTDLTMPHEWFPETRKMKRKIFYHMGPTNSGKTRGAIQRLMEAKSGLYCAPLRLLAWEISETLSNYGIPCNLITGQEKQLMVDSHHLSCTVEMADLQNEYEVAVIDEIQMIDDPERGYAWTNALLGLKAHEIHIVGEERALSLIDRMVQDTGDELFINNYERLSTLQVEHKTIRSFSEFKSGDCIIAFSRRELFQIKSQLNKHIRGQQQDKEQKQNDEEVNHCAIIYGALPPESKKNQAFMFNNRVGDIKYLVATDAIGMGLNLSIKRIIFSTLSKRVKGRTEQVNEFHIKQIAGRAGRYIEDGYVTAFRDRDLQQIRQVVGKYEKKKGNEVNEETTSQAEESSQRKNRREENLVMDSEEEQELGEEVKTKMYNSIEMEEVFDENTIPIEKLKNRQFTKLQQHISRACLFPPFQMIQQFADDLYFSDKKQHRLSEVIQKFEFLARLGQNYFIKNNLEIRILSDSLEDIPNFSLKDQYTFSLSPMKVPLNQRKKVRKLSQLRSFAEQFAAYGRVDLPPDFNISNIILNKTSYDENDLDTLEEMHNILEVYLWLGHKYESAFAEMDLCRIIAENVIKIIDQILLGKEKIDWFAQSSEGQETINPTNTCMATLCLVLNIFIPGSGTMINACFGTKCCAGFIYGLLQFFLTILLIGWIWSIMYGIKILQMSGRSGKHYHQHH